MIVIKIYLKIVVFSALIITLNSCTTNRSKLEANASAIVSLIIENSVNKYPIKSMDSTNEKFDIEKFLISMNSDKFIIAIEPRMVRISKDFGLRKHELEYQDLFEKLSLIQEEIPLKLESIKVDDKNVSIIEFNEDHNFKYIKYRT